MYNPNNVEEYMIKGDNSSDVGGIIWIIVRYQTTIDGKINKK